MEGECDLSNGAISSDLVYIYIYIYIYIVFHTKRYGNTPMGNAGDMKKSRFSANISLYLGNDTRQSHSYYGMRIGKKPYPNFPMVPFSMTLSDL